MCPTGAGAKLHLKIHKIHGFTNSNFTQTHKMNHYEFSIQMVKLAEGCLHRQPELPERRTNIRPRNEAAKVAGMGFFQSVTDRGGEVPPRGL